MGVLLLVIVVWVVIGGGAFMKVRTEARLASVEGFQRQLRSFGGGLPPLLGSSDFGPASEGPSGPSERGAQGPSGPSERGAQGPSGPSERGAQGPSGPSERGAQGPSGPSERGAQGPSGPSERGAQRSTIGHAPAIAALQGRPGDPSQRLRRGLAALLVVAAVSLVVALVTSTRVAWGVHLLVDNVVLGYVALLVRRRDAYRAGQSGRERASTAPAGPAWDDEEPEVRLLPPDVAGEGGGHIDFAVARVS